MICMAIPNNSSFECIQVFSYKQCTSSLSLYSEIQRNCTVAKNRYHTINFVRLLVTLEKREGSLCIACTKKNSDMFYNLPLARETQLDLLNDDSNKYLKRPFQVYSFQLSCLCFAAGFLYSVASASRTFRTFIPVALSITCTLFQSMSCVSFL